MESPVIRSERQVLIGLCLEPHEALSLGGVDVRRLAGHAARLQVESCLLEALTPHQLRLGPEAASWLGEMRRNVFAVAVDNLRRDEELREGLARLDLGGVPFILLKGSGLRADPPGGARRLPRAGARSGGGSPPASSATSTCCCGGRTWSAPRRSSPASGLRSTSRTSTAP